MFNESRIDIYNYIYGLLFNVVSKNVYPMYEPKELRTSDTHDGFIVIRVGNVVNQSEFGLNAFGMARCFVEAFVPPMSRGRVNTELYKKFETDINQVINDEIEHGTSEEYSIIQDSSLSWDDFVGADDDNMYYVYTKSFVVQIDNV